MPDGRGRGRLDQVLGRPDDPAAVMHALAVEAAAAEPWPADAAVARDSPPADGRLDLRHLATLTIDPEGAKDHDDALSVDGDRVYVHIADVSAHVPAGSGLDAEAAVGPPRVYLPGRVDPMLPAELSSDRCSLRAGADRLAVSLALGPDSAMSSVHRTLIRSDHTLDVPRGPGDPGRGGGARRPRDGAAPGRRRRKRPPRAADGARGARHRDA